MEVSAPPLKYVFSSFEEQEKFSSETIRVSQRWLLYLLWWLCFYSGGHTRLIWTSELNLTLKVNHPQINRYLNQGVWYLWSKFGDPNLNRWWVIMQISLWLTHTYTDTHMDTHAGNDNTQRPKLASGKNQFSFLQKGWYWMLKQLKHRKVNLNI